MRLPGRENKVFLRLGVLLGFVVATQGWPGPAAAQPGNVALADSLFEEARKLIQAGKIADACPRFEESYRLDPGGGTAIALANCYDRLGRVASSWATYRDALAIAERDKNKQRVAVIQEELKRLEPLVPKLKIQLSSGLKGAEGLEIKLDGAPFPLIALDTPRPIDPGEHRISAQASNKARKETSVIVAADGRSYSIVLPELDDLPAPAASSAPAAPAPPPASAKPPPPAAPAAPTIAAAQRPMLGWVLGGVGVLGVGVGATAGVLALKNSQDANRLCPGTLCSNAEGVSLDKTARRQALVSDIAFVVGLVGLGAGGYLLLTAPPAQAARGGGLRVGGAVAPGGGFLGVQGGFLSVAAGPVHFP